MNYIPARARSIVNISLPLDSFYEYVTTASSFYSEELFTELSEHSTAMLCAVLSAFLELCQALTCLLVLLIKIVTMLLPHLIALLRAVYEFHRTQLSVRDLIIEASVIALIIIVCIFEKQLKRLVKDIQRTVAEKSKIAAVLLPHILLLVSCTVASIALNKFIEPLTKPFAFHLLTLVVPLARTAMTLNLSNPPDGKYRMLMSMWVFLAVYHSLSLVAETFSFIAPIIVQMPFGKEIIFSILFSVQVIPGCADTTYSWIEPLLHSVLDNLLPVAKIGERAGSGIGAVLRGSGLVRDSGVQFVVMLLQETILLGIVFISLFIPGPLNLLALALVGFILPAYKTSQVLSRARTMNPLGSPAGTATPAAEKSSARRSAALEKSQMQTPPSSVWKVLTSPFTWGKTPDKKSEDDVSLRQLQTDQQHWLRYWVVFSVVCLIRLNGIYIPFKTTIVLLLSAYLQHTYLAGATKFLGSVSALVEIIILRNKKVQAERSGNSNSGDAATATAGTGDRGLLMEKKQD
jgi:hypothetical protein